MKKSNQRAVMQDSFSEKTFEKLLCWLDDDRNTAVEKYETIRLKLIKFFQWRACYAMEEYADRTLNIIANKIVVTGKKCLIKDKKGEVIKNKPGYITGIARNELQKCWKQQAQTTEILHSNEPSIDPSSAEVGKNMEDEGFDEQVLKRCRKMCLENIQKTHKNEWDLVYDYYLGLGEAKLRRKQMAEKLQISQNALMIRIHRIKDILWVEFEVCLGKCLKE